jgi:hypothetical protein
MAVQPVINVIEEGGVQVVRVLEPGSVWLIGTGAPGASLGKVGDLYLDDASGDVYGPKTTSGWGASSFTLTPGEFDKIKFNLAAAVEVAQGELAWDADNSTVGLGLGGGVISKIGQEVMLYCRNGSGVTLNIGTAVKFAGTIGNSGRLVVDKMIANGTVPGYLFLGVTTQSIAPGADGFVTTFGKVRGVNTNDYDEGVILWCDPANPGGFTVTEPSAPNVKLPVAAVVSSANNGILMVRADSGSRLQDLHDVEANGAKANLDVLHWNASNSRWEPSDRLTLLEQRVAALEG